MLSQRDQLSPSQWAVHLPEPTKVDLDGNILQYAIQDLNETFRIVLKAGFPMQSCFLLPYLLMIIVCNIHVHKKGEPAEHQPPLASGSLHPPQRRLGLAPPKHAVQVIVAAPKLGEIHISTYLSLGKDLLAIHTNGFLCQGVSKCVRLERWEVQAVVGAALEFSF